MAYDADIIIVGAGLAGLVAAAELVEARRNIIIVDQEPEQSLGGQAFWSLGGIFLVDSPEQRRMRIRDSYDLALEDWMGTAAFDREEDQWPRRWAEAYVAFAAGEKGPWLRQRGIKFFPVVGWAERGGRTRSDTGIPCRAFTSLGAPGRALSRRSCSGYAKVRSRAWSRSNSGTASTNSRAPAGRLTG
jgi:uncharacterized protein